MSFFSISMIRSYAYQQKLVRFLKDSENWSIEEWKDYQDQAVEKLFTHCCNHVPYYKKICQNYDINIGNESCIDTIKNFPFLTKELVGNNTREFMALNYSRKNFELKKTSGTTNHPLQFYVEKGKWLAQHLAYNRVFMSRGGYKQGDRTLSLLGIPNKHRYHRFLNTLELSSLHLHDSCNEYLDKIKKFNPKYIVTYPSALYFLSKFILETNYEIQFNPKAIFFHGEPVFDWQIDVIKQVFHSDVFDIYGNGEKNVLSATCEQSGLHHVFPSYCFVELIDKHGKEVTKEGAYAEIVSTGLNSFLFPFIRYRTGDVGVYTHSSCSCKRNFPIIMKIVGRKKDCVLDADKHIIPSSVINEIVANHSNGIFKWQFVQKRRGVLTLSLLPREKNEKKIKDIKKDIKFAFEKMCPHQIDLKFNIVDNLNHPSSRKHSFLIQHLPTNLLDIN
jgi:phenylacetate-CoA ligase